MSEKTVGEVAFSKLISNVKTALGNKVDKSELVEQTNDLICVYYTSNYIRNTLQKNFDNLPCNTYLWTSKDSWDNVPEQAGSVFWIFTLSNQKDNRNSPGLESAATQFIVSGDTGKIIARRIKSKQWQSWSTTQSDSSTEIATIYSILNDKQNKLTAGNGIEIIETTTDEGTITTISATGSSGESSGGTISVDDNINGQSLNPVQNRVIHTALQGKQDKLTAGSGISISGNTVSATGGGSIGNLEWIELKTTREIAEGEEESDVVLEGINYQNSDFFSASYCPTLGVVRFSMRTKGQNLSVDDLDNPTVYYKEYVFSDDYPSYKPKILDFYSVQDQGVTQNWWPAAGVASAKVASLNDPQPIFVDLGLHGTQNNTWHELILKSNESFADKFIVVSGFYYIEDLPDSSSTGGET